MSELVLASSSTPSLKSFDPKIIPYQYRVIKDVRKKYDYQQGTHEILLSGSVGSAKSILMAHMAVTHCLMYPGARAMLGRLAMPDLKSTIFNKIVEHISPDLRENRDFFANQTIAKIKFKNGSEIISRSWADRKFFKVRSLELSAAFIEETAENDEDVFYNEVKMRVGRLPHVPENIIMHATNPDSPSHWLYKYFIASKNPTRHVYYSVTTDNPFLPKQYIEQLKRDLDPKMARRMLFGEWLEIAGEVIYYAYDRSVNFRDEVYLPSMRLPVHLMFDFNIGEGKPMSCALGQFAWPHIHIFNESVVHGARTADIFEDLDARGLLTRNYTYVINGDASGRHKDTRSSRSDYDIIMSEMSKRGLQFEMRVPLANPPIRTRHNRVNGACKNSAGEVSLYVYQTAPTADEGFRLTKLKNGGSYIEDDSKPFQHITTAIGYGIVMESNMRDHKPSRTTEL